MKCRVLLSILSSASVMFLIGPVSGQVADAPDGTVAGISVNYTEARVGAYTLPDPLKLDNGQVVKEHKTWNEQRRPELLKYYQSEIYGCVPATAPKVVWQVVSNDASALGGAGVLKELAGHMGTPDGPAIAVTLYTPAKASKPVPILVSISFNFPSGGRRRGPASTNATPRQGNGGASTNAAGAGGVAMRGTPAELISHGFGYARIIYNTIETDIEGQTNVNLARKLALAPAQTAPAADEWGAIAAWAWGISRFVDYLETDPAVDSGRIAITGVSRLGKTVLWAGANDPRIALVIASSSGEGGAALARRNYGETIAHLVASQRFPYQFAGNFVKYAKDPSQLAVDTHCLIALIAPRPLLLQTGDTDHWSDPKGEFLAAVAARPVYELFGKKGPEVEQMPHASELLGDTLAYYMHAGGHGTIPSDWDIYLKFLEKHLKR